MKRIVMALSALAVVLATGQVLAQAYPVKPVRIIVPFGAGGGTDIQGRLLAQKFQTSMGQNFLVENRAGASGLIGAEFVARAPADGYTIFLAGLGSHGLNPNTAKKPLYDPVRDFDAISLIASAPLLVASPALAAGAEDAAMGADNPVTGMPSLRAN